VKSTDFSVKDGLLPGDPAKIVKGTEIDDEFDAISAAIQTKADLASPTFSGTPAAPTASPGTNTTQIATTAFAAAAATAAANTALGTLGTLSTQNANNVSITGGSVTGITDITVADGGTGVSSIAANNVMLGNGTSPIQVVAPSTTGNVLTSNGSTWESTAPAAPTTTQVLNATASATAGGVGTYAYLAYSSAFNQGDTASGSSLAFTAIWDTRGGYFNTNYATGTWRAMGASPGNVMASVWLRIA
jgi:hypothetical protein